MRDLRQPCSRRSAVVALFAALGLAGCSSTRIVSEWSNPADAAVRFQRVLVVGVSTQSSRRRTFEDTFAARLRAAGVDAVPSYLFIPEGGRVDATRLQEAVRRAGADAVLMTRLVRVEKETRVTQAR